MIELNNIPWDAEAIAALKAAEAFDTTGGLVTVESCAEEGAVLFEIVADGARVALYALAVNRWAHGNEGVVCYAAGGKAGVSLTRGVLPLIEKQFVDCRAVKIETKRKALVHQLAKQGYRLDGFIMRKTLGVQH